MRKQSSHLCLGALIGGALVAALLLWPVPAAAHHGWAGPAYYVHEDPDAFHVPLAAHHGWAGQGDEEFELTGTVETPVSLAGPHATMKIRAEGQVWDITLAPPARTSGAGLKEGIIPVGAKVTVRGHRNRDKNRFEIKTERVTWNGKVFAVYPDRD